MSRTDSLREQVLELRIRERELTEQKTAIDSELETNRAEQARLKALLISEAKTTMRLVTAKESARGTLARLEVFTLSEAIAELGWDKPRVKKLIDAMMCEKPPAVTPDGKLGTKPVYKYTGPPIELTDPIEEREAAALEAVRDWIVTQTTVFTPGEAAAAIGLPRATTLRALRALQQTGALVDEGPTLDMPMFRRTDVEAPDVAIDRPALEAVEDKEFSKIPQVQELLAAADRAGCAIEASNGHFAIEALDGRRVIVDAVPNRKSLLEGKARLRRIGVNV